jgi:FxLD family lantipeptide
MMSHDADRGLATVVSTGGCAGSRSQADVVRHASKEANETPMSTSILEFEPQVAEAIEPDPFDLDIRFIESGGQVADLINLTDDGCGSTCYKACVTTPG